MINLMLTNYIFSLTYPALTVTTVLKRSMDNIISVPNSPSPCISKHVKVQVCILKCLYTHSQAENV